MVRAWILAAVVAMLATGTALKIGHGRVAEIDPLKQPYHRPADTPYPADNPYSDAKYTLGKSLFFDPRLSASGVTSCASCHNPGLSWGDGLPTGIGFEHKKLARKTPPIVNLAWDELYFWDGRSSSLEAQALDPIASSTEMHMPLDEMVRAIDKPAYQAMFALAFPGDAAPLTPRNVAKAIATFERTIVSDPAPFDRWIAGDENAIPEAAKRGFALFTGKARCAGCHSGWRFTDGGFHDIGLGDPDAGRGKILPLPTMQHAFKTPGLRNIDLRYPYMHDGSLPTLDAVLDHYDHGFVQRASLDDRMRLLLLTTDEKMDLLAFLHTLTEESRPISIPNLPR